MSPVEALEASLGHQCQNDHGVRADVVMVQLATGECDILCQVCAVTMMSAAFSAAVDGNPELAHIAEATAAQLATEAASAALAAD
jgi:hypothetical protein